jgi:glycosyltransferase
MWSPDMNKIIRTWRSGYFKKEFLLWMDASHPAFFVRKEVYEKVGLFNTQLKSQPIMK